MTQDRELAPCPHCGSSPSDLTTAYLAGVHHDGECRRHYCRRVRIEMQVEIERLREEVASLEADTGPCRAHACRRVRTEMQAEIERLRAAIARQVANIDRWLETGIPADADESKSIYDQLCEAIGTAMAKERGE